MLPADLVDVVLEPEGPQREDLAVDVQQALSDNAAAGANFDGLAQFYRNAFLKWIDATKRKPDERQRRIAEMVEIVARGEKQVPDARGATLSFADQQRLKPARNCSLRHHGPVGANRVICSILRPQGALYEPLARTPG